MRGLPGRAFTIGREALRTLLARHGITFQRTKTWKESPDPDFDAKLDEIEYALTQRPERTFAFDEFGPLGIRPTAGSGWAPQGEPDRLPATYPRTEGVRYFHGCYSVGDDLLWGVNRARKGIGHTWAALRSIRAACPDGAPIYVILDNLSAHKNWRIRAWAKKNKVNLLFTPTYASWANPIEAHFGPLRRFPWPTPTTRTTPSRPGRCTPTCAGATPTLATPMSWLPNAANAPESAARKASAGAADPCQPQDDRAR
nr:IS630 family transposase [Nonomuraea mesophila]